MTVHENMSFGLRLRKLPKDEIQRRVKAAAEILDIGELLARRPKQLSGGQRQRVAMGRAIVRNPEAFLFDEPLSNLDAKLRVQMRTEIKLIHRRVRTTVVYVTHDQVEAMTLADRIVVMNDGLVEQVASPQEMYDNPSTRFVAGFIGSPSMNFLPCKLTGNGSGLSVILSDGVRLNVPADRESRYRDHVDRNLTFGIRPEHLTEQRQHTNADQQDFSWRVGVLEPNGNRHHGLHEHRGGGRVRPRGAQVGKEPRRGHDVHDRHAEHAPDRFGDGQGPVARPAGTRGRFRESRPGGVAREGCRPRYGSAAALLNGLRAHAPRSGARITRGSRREGSHRAPRVRARR